MALVWLGCLGVLGAGAWLYVVLHASATIDEVFLLRQDRLVAVTSLPLFALIALPLCRLGPRAALAARTFADRHGALAGQVAAGLVAAGAFAGWRLVYQAYPLSMDEFWATFDARIFSHGGLVAWVAPEWRPFLPSLQPVWRLVTPGARAWASTYLPVNAAFRGLFGLIGSQALAGPVWAALSVVLVYGLGRRLWPERRDAAFVTAILLASSAQVIVTAMSPYAMSAHLALNLAWLWLFLRRGALAQGAAAGVAFLATGLHQFIFHPLFAAPFVLRLWLQRRWRLAAFHTAAYAVIGLFWVSWWPIVFASQGFPVSAAHVATAGASAEALSMAFSPWAPGLMAENLLRLMLWQNPLTIPLALLGAWAAWRARDGAGIALAAGPVLTLLFLLLVTPFQGHGWGYRYLHGCLGSLCLLGARGWIGADGAPWDAESGRPESRSWAALAAATACALCVWLPIRLAQVHAFIAPYARAWAAIAAAPADVVVVDTAGLWYGDDLVRNDPFLRQGPKVLRRLRLTDAQLRGLCDRYRVAYFGRREAAAFGLPRSAGKPPPRGLAPPPCGARLGRTPN